MKTDTDITCPVCKVGTLELVLDGEVTAAYFPKIHWSSGRNVGDIDWRREPHRFVACNSCEFCKKF